MIHFMRENTGQQTLPLDNLFAALQILARYDHPIGAPDLARKVWDAEATLLFVLLAFLVDNLRIHQSDQLPLLLASGRIDNNQTLQNTNLRRCQTDTRSGIRGWRADR